MIYVIMGKSATGKDTVFRQLMKKEELGLNKIVPYTTRPQRFGETEGEDYHFVDEEEMKRLDKAGLIAEHREYNTVKGVWHYFTVDDNPDVCNNELSFMMIGTVEAFLSLRKYFGNDMVIPIYIYVNDYERLIRSINRERKQDKPNYEEVCRRYIADEQDFSSENLNAAGIDARYRYNNSDLKLCINNIVKDLLGKRDDNISQ